MIFSTKAYICDNLRMLGKITPGKLLNYVLNHLSWQFSFLLKRPLVWGSPFSVNFETAAVCNLKCPECLTGIGQTQRNNKVMPQEFFLQKLRLHSASAFYCNLYFQGEPFLHPQIYEMIGAAHREGFYTVISTNGHFLDDNTCHRIIDNRLSRLIVSLDGIENTTYSRYRVNGLFEKVVQGIETLARIKAERKVSYPYLEIQFLVNKTNEHEVKKAPGFIKKLGADAVKFKSMQVYTSAGHESLLPVNTKYNRYSPQNETKKVTRCFRLWSHMVYTSDGVLVPCCYDKIPQHGISGIGNNLEGQWKSDRLQLFRKKLIRGEVLPEICSNCLP